MKRKLIISVILLLSIVFVRLEVNAAGTNADPGDDNYTTLQSAYNKGITKTSVSGSDWVTIYGKAECNGSSCTISYPNSITSVDTILSKSVSCSGGETSINYTEGTTGRTPYVENGEKINGTGYFSDEYYVTCTTSNGAVNLENSTNGSTNAGSSNVGNNYQGSTTTENPETGVNTYFVVLGIMAVMSYGIMIILKRYNLFKKI